jgi:hypothetical protein
VNLREFSSELVIHYQTVREFLLAGFAAAHLPEEDAIEVWDGGEKEACAGFELAGVGAAVR